MEWRIPEIKLTKVFLIKTFSKQEKKHKKKVSYKTRERKPKTFSTPLWNLKFIIQEHIGKES